MASNSSTVGSHTAPEPDELSRRENRQPLKPGDVPEPPEEKQLPYRANNTPSDHGETDEKPLGPNALSKLRVTALIIGVSLGLFLSMIDGTIVATALFSIAVEFGDVDNINWVALSYVLTYLGCAVLFARASDVVGRRNVFAAAYVLFVAFSLACGFSRTMDQLIAFRAIQGLGGSGLYSVSMIIMPEVTPDRAKKYIAGVVGLVLAASGVLGPVLGGILTEYAGWRWVFWINGPIGGASILIFLLSWPKEQYLPTLERRSWSDIDLVGAFLLIAAAVLIVFPFQHAMGAVDPWTSATFLATLIIGIACLAALFIWQAFLTRRITKKASSPAATRRDKERVYSEAFALPPVLLRNRVYAAAAVHTMLTGFPYILCVYAFPIRFQVVYGRSALDAGLMLLPMLAGTAFGTMLTGAVNGRDGHKVRFLETLVAACVLMLLGCGLEITADDSGELEPKVLGFLAFVGVGFGLSAAGATMLTNAEAPVYEHASAQGIIAQVRMLGGSIGIAASSAILGTKFRAELAGTTVISPDVLTYLASDPGILPAETWAVIRRVYTQALRENMIVCCAVLAAALGCSLFVYKRDTVSLEGMVKMRYQEEEERRREVSKFLAEGNGQEQV
ncbi:hypothetical protein VTJ49DRAFT_6532 [Mycothermus thermophilus]|uniref:Major facilitator superfamily (MFS) profile domain-containing protein n=1 Tax=Humicola insolens TaxID=85995 RepID=A0ABR3VKF6_HUMIN